MITLVALAGGLGAVCRYLADTWVTARTGRAGWGTTTVNVVGSFLLGFLLAAASRHAESDWTTVAGTGFLGGFTTFSAFAVESARLLRGGRHRAAVGHALVMVLAAVAAAVLGVALAALI